jgi:excisionase family DNA binding protein
MNDDHFLTTDEAVDYLQINHRTLYRLLKVGGIPAVRVGRQWRFRTRDIDAWAAARQRDRTTSGARVRVLVVDDDPSVSKYIGEALSMADYDVDFADNGERALVALEETSYGLLVTDLKMPGMDGLTLIREARRRAFDLPVVIITGQSTEQSAIDAINLGVTGYLLKPFTPQMVLTVAARALGSQQEVPLNAAR